jgi:hypothetical protein
VAAWTLRRVALGVAAGQGHGRKQRLGGCASLCGVDTTGGHCAAAAAAAVRSFLILVARIAAIAAIAATKHGS